MIFAHSLLGNKKQWYLQKKLNHGNGKSLLLTRGVKNSVAMQLASSDSFLF
jgi:hypothetical protein